MGRRKRSTTAFSLFAFQDIITSVTGIMILVTLILSLELIHRKETSPVQQTAQVSEDVETAIADSNRMQQMIEDNLAMIEGLKEELAKDQKRIEIAAKVDLRSAKSRLNDLKSMNESMRKEREKLDSKVAKASDRVSEAKSALDRMAGIEEEIDALKKQTLAKKKELDGLKKSSRLVFNPSEKTSKKAWLVEIAAKNIGVTRAGTMDRPRMFASSSAFLAWTKTLSSSSDYFVLLVKPSGVESFNIVRQAIKRDGFEIGYELLAERQTTLDTGDTGS